MTVAAYADVYIAASVCSLLLAVEPKRGIDNLLSIITVMEDSF